MAIKIPFTDLWLGKKELPEERLAPLATKSGTRLTRHAEGGSYGGQIGWGDPSPGFIPSGGGIGTLYGYNWQFVARRGEKMAVMNGMFRRLHEIMRDNVCGQGFTCEVACDEEFKGIEKCLQAILDDNTLGEVNRLDLAIPNWVFESLLYGELPILPFVNEQNGDVKWCYVPPRTIKEVYTIGFTNEIAKLSLDQGQWDVSKGAVVWEGFNRMLDVMHFDLNPYQTDAAGRTMTDRDEATTLEFNLPNLAQNTIQGDIFFQKFGAVASQVRGQGEGFAIMDMILELEQFQYDFARAFNLQSSIVWHETLIGGDQPEIDAASQELLPTGRQKYVTNEKRTLQMLSPTMKVDDLSNYVRTYMVQIGGAIGIPEYMLGDGSQTNVATAREQAPSLYQKFVTRQNQTQAFMQMLMRYVIEQKNARGMIHDDQGKTVTLKPADFKKINIAFSFLPFERNNSDTFATSFKTLIDGVVEATTNNIISEKVGRNVAQTSLAAVGVDVDDDEDMEQMKNEKAAKPPVSMGANGKPIDQSLLPKAPVPKPIPAKV